MRRRMFLAAMALAALPLLAGCGSGGGGGQGPATTPVYVTMHWPERSRAVEALSSALSAVLTLQGAKADGTDLKFTMNRDANPADHTSTYASVDTVRPGAWPITVNFYTLANGGGTLVGTASATATIQADGTGIGTLAPTGVIATVEIAAGQSVAVGQARDLTFTTKDASGALIAVTPGSATYTVVTGSDLLKFTAGQAQGIKPGTATVTATVDGKTSAAATITITTGVTLTLSPGSVEGGNPVTGTIKLAFPAPAGGATIALSSSNTAVATVPASVVIGAGQSSKTFTVSTQSVTSSSSVTLQATYSGEQRTATLTVTPGSLSAFSVSPGTAPGGSTVTGTLVLGSPAPAGGATISLASDNAAATVPATVSVNAGQTSATFPITTSTVTAQTTATLTAGYAGATKTATLTVQTLIGSLSVAPDSVACGNTSQGTVTLNLPAPAGGGVVSLTSSNPQVATPPGSVTVPGGGLTATFTINTTAVAAITRVSISAAYAGASKTVTLTVLPLLQSVSVNPVTVSGGSTSLGTILLSGPAPAGGVIVNLASDTGAASVPDTVTVGAGQTTAVFTITTTAVAAQQTASISATRDGLTKSAALTITP